MKSRVCLVRHREYQDDARIDNQIQALLDHGYNVDLLCIRGAGESLMSVDGGIRVYRLPSLARKRGGKLRYFAEYTTFLLTSLLALIWLQTQNKYNLVHVCNLPDFLVFAALGPKILGAKIILDFRECTPEQYHAKYGVSMDSALMKCLIAIEQGSIKFANAALTCTEQMRQALIQRGANPKKVFVMLNSADPNIFKDPVLPEPTTQKKNGFRMVIHGTIIKRYGHDILVRAMPYVLKKIPGAQLEIIGEGEWQPELEQLVNKLGLNNAVTFAGYLPLAELLKRLRRADCGVVPLPQNPETDLIHTFKMQEYMALGIPVIISRTRAIEAYYDEDSVCFFKPGSEKDLAQAVIKFYKNPQLRHSLAENALKTYKRYSAPKQQAYYANLVRSLLGDTPVSDHEYLLYSDNRPVS